MLRTPAPLIGALAVMGDIDTPQQEMDRAFDNYLALSDLLRSDLEALMEGESRSPSWRRNFIRITAALVEGYAHCFRQMCAVSSHSEAPAISTKERAVILDEAGFDTTDRLKLTLRAAYKLFDLTPVPHFGGQDWAKAQLALDKRHKLMHPKTPEDLAVPDESWEELREGVIWMLEQLFNFIAMLKKKHDG